MSYQRLALDPGLDRVVRDFIRLAIEDLHFRDIHGMLRLPLPEQGVTVACNFTIAGALLRVIGGISTVLYSRDGGDRERYQEVLTQFYPWLSEASGQPPEWGSQCLYNTFRNPLSHSLGMVDTKREWSGGKPKVVRTPNLGAVGIGRGAGLSESEIETLETSQVRPAFCGPTLRLDDEGTITLDPEALYWGCRRMVESLSANQPLMTAATEFIGAG